MTDGADSTDATIAFRAGEQVDADALLAWLAAAVPDVVPAGARLFIRQFPAGFSNLTYLVTMEHEHGRRALVLRRPPRGVKPGIAHDMGREYGILAALHPRGVPVPRPASETRSAYETRSWAVRAFRMLIVNSKIALGFAATSASTAASAALVSITRARCIAAMTCSGVWP